ncbi:MAG TPA: hypothetical protein ENN69_09185, partial [Spirochaetia bacterium]|nr:hypothetical protein [Spirochaetia bacterium]
HARTDFFLSVMRYPFTGSVTALELLEQGLLQIVCLGDGFHAEGRRAARWKHAFEEFRDGYRKHKYMDDEMRESLGVMEMVLELKKAFPLRFHFLKGNHENISNEHGGGNYPFRKYAYEGAMVLEYVKQFYGEEFLAAYYQIEKHFPLLAVGGNFIISHAEPKKFFKANRVLNYRSNADVVYGLTWTDNDEAAAGSVRKMIEHYLPPETWESARYFGGHRPVAGLLNARADGQYLQIHNPQGFQVAYCQPFEPVNEETCMVEIPDVTGGM